MININRILLEYKVKTRLKKESNEIIRYIKKEYGARSTYITTKSLFDLIHNIKIGNNAKIERIDCMLNYFDILENKMEKLEYIYWVQEIITELNLESEGGLDEYK